jgi:transposase
VETTGTKHVVARTLTKEAQSLNELAQKYELAPSQISKWKRDFLANLEVVFGQPVKDAKSEAEEERDCLLRTIGEQKVELDFLKNALR